MTDRQAEPSLLNIRSIAGLLLAGLFVLSGCNTVAGLGEDVETAGEAMSDKAEDVQD